MRRKARHKLEALLAPADVKVGGDRPWDIQVYNDEFCARVLSEGSMGLGESYMDGWWDCAKLDDFFYRILRAGLHDKSKPWIEVFRALKGRLVNLQRPSRAYQIGQHHYDMGNTLFKCTVLCGPFASSRFHKSHSDSVIFPGLAQIHDQTAS